MGKARTVLAWVAAIAALFVVFFLKQVLGGKVGVPVSLEVDPYTVRYGSRGPEEEYNSITTAYGWGVLVLSFLAAFATWHFVQGKAQTYDGRTLFFGLLLGSAVLLIGGIFHWKVFAHSEGPTAIIGNVLELGLFGAAFLAGRQLYRRLNLP